MNGTYLQNGPGYVSFWPSASIGNMSFSWFIGFILLLAFDVALIFAGVIPALLLVIGCVLLSLVNRRTKSVYFINTGD